jgi:hypothetical protein
VKWSLVLWNLVVPDVLLSSLVEYLSTVEFPGDKIDVVPIEDDTIIVDLPGICSSRRHLHDLQVDGLTFYIPSTDFVFLYYELEGLPPCHEGGMVHYRLYGSMRTLCLTVQQRGALLRQMASELLVAREIADAENKQINEALSGAHEHGVLCWPRDVIDREIPES